MQNILFSRSRSYFYPRSPCGERRRVPAPASCCTGISIHALLAESDYVISLQYRNARRFLSTLSLRRATRYVTFSSGFHVISIHALLAESDAPPAGRCIPHLISIHALLAESDHSGQSRVFALPSFLSTLSLRRATLLVSFPCVALFISIHALLAESDDDIPFVPRCTIGFLSTLSLRRAT